MTRQLATTVATYGVLALAGGVSYLLPDTLTMPATLASPSPGVIDVTGIVRDFRKTHVDFNVGAPDQGFGHYAGNIQSWLPGDRRPVFIGGGHKIDAQWTDSDSRPISSMLANVRPGYTGADRLGVRVNGKIKVEDEAQIDSFDSRWGAYGIGGNYGSRAVVATNSTAGNAVEIKSKSVVFGDVLVGPGGDSSSVIRRDGFITGQTGAQIEAYPITPVSVPDALDTEPTQGDVTWSSQAVTLTGFVPASEDDIDLTKALRYDRLEITDDSVLTVEGDLRIVCDELKIHQGASIVLAVDANLAFFVTGDHDLNIDDAQLNTGGPDFSTDALTINYMGNKHIHLKKSHVYGVITAVDPDSKLEIDEAHLYGAYVGEELVVKKKAAGLHVDVSSGAMGVWNPAVTVKEKFEVDDNSVINSWDSNLGPYDGPDAGGTNWGTGALVQSNALKNDKVKVKKDSIVHGDVLTGPGTDPDSVIKLEDGGVITGNTTSMAVMLPIPTVTPPALGLPEGGDVEYKDGTFTISSNLRCKKLTIDKAVVWIDGDVTIRVDKEVDMRDSAEIQLLPNARLTLYVNKGIKIENKCLVNTVGGNAQDVSIRRMSLGKKGKVEIKKESQVCAWIQGAKTELKLEDQAVLFGNFMGEKVTMKVSQFHVDMAYLTICVDVDDTAGAIGSPNEGGIASAASFSEWFNDLPGTNIVRPLTISMTLNSGVYEYVTSAFHPIDDVLYGNEGDTHNNYFTYEIRAEFVYDQCGGNFVEFGGGDGAWAFIDRRLVVDLGGVNTGVNHYVEIDRLGLEDGRTYMLHLLYADRNAADDTFHLRTDLELSTRRTIPVSSEAFD